MTSLSIPFPAGTARRSAVGISLVGAAFLLLAGCGEQEDWSPLDGPWDPEHPEAARILASPDPAAPIDREMAEAGERWYRVRGCLACHAFQGDGAAGPGMSGVTLRRDYDWFKGMVMRPDSMLQVDPVARQLLEVYRIPMPNQGVDELRARAMWEYLRMLDRRSRSSPEDPGP